MIVVVYCHLYFTENQPRLLDFYQTDFIVVNLSELVALAVVGHMMIEFDIGLFLLDKPKSVYMYHLMLFFLVVRHCGKSYLGIKSLYRS